MVAWAQQPKTMRRIGVLTGGLGPDSQARLETFLKALAQLGWTDGQNVRLEIRRGAGDAAAIPSSNPMMEAPLVPIPKRSTSP